MFSLLRPVFVALLAATLPFAASAELRSELSAFVVTKDSNGVEHYASADSVEPGQLIEYRLAHTNMFDDAIGGVAIVGPIPAEAVFAAGSASSSAQAVFEIRADLDPDQPGEEWSSLPAQRIVVQPDGTREIVGVSPEEYTAVRWKIASDLGSNTVVSNSYRVRVR